jgi:hypothetical protein
MPTPQDDEITARVRTATHRIREAAAPVRPRLVDPALRGIIMTPIDTSDAGAAA